MITDDVIRHGEDDHGSTSLDYTRQHRSISHQQSLRHSPLAGEAGAPIRDYDYAQNPGEIRELSRREDAHPELNGPDQFYDGQRHRRNDDLREVGGQQSSYGGDQSTHRSLLLNQPSHEDRLKKELAYRNDEEYLEYLKEQEN